MARRKLELEPRKEVESEAMSNEVTMPIDIAKSTAVSTLKKLVDEYGEAKATFNSLKKLTDGQNDSLKKLMTQLLEPDEEGIRKADGDNFIAVLSIRDTSTMNEERLITFLKKKGHAKGIVKKKEYVDEKALTDAIYKGIISEQEVTEMESCKDPSSSKVLNVKKKKGAK